MENNKIKLKNPKISVHIPYFFDSKKKSQVKNFNKVCKSFLNISKNTKIFVHTNKKNKNKKNIKFISYKFKDDHPYKLTWYPRKLMEKQKNNFDIFIYCEDDLLFTKKNFNYWLKYKDIFLKNNYNVGFVRVEVNKKDKLMYTADQVSKSKFFVEINSKKYLVISNPHCAFWIYDKNEFNEFVKTKFYKFEWKWITKSGILLSREMASHGWYGTNMNGIDMNRYKATIIPFKKNHIDKDSLVRHLSDTYCNNPAGIFGTFKLKDIIDSELIKFKPVNSYQRILKRVKYLLYYYSRLNLKKYIKLFK